MNPHPINQSSTYVNVVLPLAVDKLYSYRVPNTMGKVEVGCRVEVQFGPKRHYSALVTEVIEDTLLQMKTKPILSIIDERPVVLVQQLKLWEWISEYYNCTLGEVMIAAMPSIFRLSSETSLVRAASFEEIDLDELDGDEFMIAEALEIREEISLTDVRVILDKKNVFPILENLLFKGVLRFKEEMKKKYRPKYEEWLTLGAEYRIDPPYEMMFDSLKRASVQTDCLLGFVQYSGRERRIPLRTFLAQTGGKRTTVKALVDKGFLAIEKVSVNRMISDQEDIEAPGPLDEQQGRAMLEIEEAFAKKKPVLLHGVTGSGKTRVYIECIQKCLQMRKQVLYLLPEIALTSQIEGRLRKYFGNKVISVHSRLNGQERADAWKLISKGFPVVLAPRSGAFLPFKDLGLIVIDESHDSSFKQQNPAPRYHGRDVALFLAQQHGAQIVLGSATPSLESLYNAREGRFAKVDMPLRYGDSELPELQIVSLQEDRPLEQETDIFSQTLLTEIETALSRDKQVILFQNRRGYAPVLMCRSCDWKADCLHCDVSLTVHKGKSVAQCHLCNYKTPIPSRCPRCHGQLLSMTGFGTEKIVEEINEFFPGVAVDRLDHDTTRQKDSFQKIIDRFTYKESKILVGTQMITKGLDFDHVAIVGILLADQSLYYPDFRANERAFQLFTQVSGRAGRREDKGKVIIQTMRAKHPVLKWLQEEDFSGFVTKELEDRKEFVYPPYVRMIRITGLHSKIQIAYDGTQILYQELAKEFGHWVSSVAPNSILRIKNKYIYQFMIKIPKTGVHYGAIRNQIRYQINLMRERRLYKGVRFIVDVDPVF